MSPILQTRTITYLIYLILELLLVGLGVYSWRSLETSAKLLVNKYKKKITIEEQRSNSIIETMNSIENQTKLLNKISKTRKEDYKNLAIDAKTKKANNPIKKLADW